MADPKYANLPGIDADSPDVFETSDLPEDDQNQLKRQDELNDCVEKINVTTDQAFKAFQGKGVSMGATDFSDSVGKSRATGYYADLNEYEMAGADGRKETAQQKYQRLQHEMRELAEEVAKAKDNATSDQASASPVALGGQLAALQQQLADLHLETLLGSQARPDMADPQGQLTQRLMTQLDSFPSADSGKKKDKGGAGDQLVYQLYHRPEAAQMKKNAKMAKLEERLERLENAIGKNVDKTNVLTTDTENKSLIGAVATLNSKLSLLDASNTETVEARLNAVLQKMAEVAAKKEKDPQADPERREKVNELFELTKKWEATADSLPTVVDRLVALNTLHEQALQFSAALAYLDTAQQEVARSLATNNDMQKQLGESLKENQKLIQLNVGNMESRLKALNK